MPDYFLEYEDREEIIRILAYLDQFTDQRGRRQVLERALLTRFISGIDFSGSPTIVAAEIVSKLERYGELAERPTYHALGALLNFLLKIRTIPEKDRKFIAQMIYQYSLVSDPRYRENLTEEYEFEIKTIRKASEEFESPTLPVKEFISGPDFEVEFQDKDSLESIINSEDNFLDIHILYGAIYSSQAVGRIEHPLKTAIGTGFLIGPDLVLTNQHVLKDKHYLEGAVIRFGFMMDASGATPAGNIFKFKSDFYHSSPAEELDYALVRLKEFPIYDKTQENEIMDKTIPELVLMGKHRGYLQVSNIPLNVNERVNIIQHPNGDPLKVVLTQNYVASSKDKRVQYRADTMNGSSGSPVFNQNWDVVALHHSGKPYPPNSIKEVAKKVWKGDYRVNEGIPMKAIIKDFKDKGINDLLP